MNVIDSMQFERHAGGEPKGCAEFPARRPHDGLGFAISETDRAR
jgi:hypothetical protein